MNINCGICDRASRSGEQLDISCSGFCNKRFHKKCAKLTEYDVDLIRKTIGLSFICELCQNSMEVIKNNHIELLKSIEDNTVLIENKIDEKLNSVLKSIDDIKKSVLKEKKSDNNKTKNDISYADSVKLPVYIKPKDNNQNKSNTHTKAQIRNVAQPSKLSVEIKNMRELNDGIVINCANENSVKIIQKTLIEKLSDDYEITVPKMKNPYVLVVGMSEQLNQHYIENAIKSQNNIDFKELKCHKVYESPKYKNSYNAIVEVDGESFKKIITNGKLSVEWDRCVVYEHFNVLRCLKCCGFNHKAKDCTIGFCCYKCGNTNHKASECSSNLKICLNCNRLKNNSNNQNVNVDHHTKSVNCPLFKTKVMQEKNKTVY